MVGNNYFYIDLEIPEYLSICNKCVSELIEFLKSKKLEVVGLGIDTSRFVCKSREGGVALHILSVGRISPIKKYETLIKAAEILVHRLRLYLWEILCLLPMEVIKRV